MIINESFLSMSIINKGTNKNGPYIAIKSNNPNKLYDLKNELFQQLGNNSISTDIKKDVLYVYFDKEIDQLKLDKLFTKYHVK